MSPDPGASSDIAKIKHRSRAPVAIYLPSLVGGGAERVMATLAGGLNGRGIEVDMVLARAVGPYLDELPQAVNVVDLHASKVLTSLAGFTRYLRQRRPVATISALSHANVLVLLARQLAGVKTRVVVTEHDTVGASRQAGLKAVVLRTLMKRFYKKADAVVAVSMGVADDLAATLGIPRSSITTIYNPVVSGRLAKDAQTMPAHPWFAPGQPPVILGVGRLTRPKDFSALIRAFALLRQEFVANLLILGEGEERDELTALVRAHGLEHAVDLPGFVDNPFAFMRHAALFVLSSAREGLPTVLIEAMACGAPVVSTDCPSGPVEILQAGRWGRLVPVGDVEALANAMRSTLEETAHPDVIRRASAFGVDVAVNSYLDVLGARSLLGPGR